MTGDVGVGVGAGVGVGVGVAVTLEGVHPFGGRSMMCPSATHCGMLSGSPFSAQSCFWYSVG
jgi:hypothetical protein